MPHDEPADIVGNAFDMSTFDSSAFGGGEWTCDDD